jgi:hypothetical protein
MMMCRAAETSSQEPHTLTHFNILEDGILHSHSLENLKSYETLNGWPM